MTQELTAPQAAQVMSVDHSTVFRWVDDGLLPARRVGLKRAIIINVADLKAFATKNNYPFDETKAAQLAAQ